MCVIEKCLLQNMEDNRQRIPENEETTQAQPICSQVFETSLKDMEAELASLRNEKSNVEEKLYDLQQQMEIMTPERDELKVRIQSLISERDQLKEDLGENIEMVSTGFLHPLIKRLIFFHHIIRCKHSVSLDLFWLRNW